MQPKDKAHDMAQALTALEEVRIFLLYFFGGLVWLCAHTDVWLAYAHAYT